MRVLMLHNRYRADGGEERAVADISWLLASRGHTVQVLERSSTEASRPRAARSLVWGGLGSDEVAAAARRMSADVVHVHNVHPLFGWRALAAARTTGARTVLHLHNFRLFCAIGVAYRDGAPCFRCRGRDTRPGLRLRCRGTIGESAAYAVGLSAQQPRLFEHADRFVTVSHASARRLFELGLPVERTRTLSNFVRTPGAAEFSAAAGGAYALVSGRLVEEKGFDTAIEAARRAGVPLLIAGDGPDRERLGTLAVGADVRFLGWLEPGELTRVRRAAAVVLVPSRWEESFPYAALDALADGVPVIASDLGGLAEIAGPESVLPATDLGAWSQMLSRLWGDPGTRAEWGERQQARVRQEFSESRYHDELMRIYTE